MPITESTMTRIKKNDATITDPGFLTLRSGSSLYVCDDILELIITHLRNDPSTLIACALVSPSLLRISRKRLYRSVSLDYCENQYAYEQQKLLRSTLADNRHLSGYIRTVRMRLSPDPVLRQILENVRNEARMLEEVHIIGGGGRYSGDDDMDDGIEDSLSGVFALPNLRKVTLENVYPFSEVYISNFTCLKHLELLSVDDIGGKARTQKSLIPVFRLDNRMWTAPLESLTLKVHHLSPIFEAISRASASSSSSSIPDLSQLKQAHIYTSNSEDAEDAWSLINPSSKTLECLTLNYFRFLRLSGPSSSQLPTPAYPSLHTLHLTLPTFIPSTDPLRSLITFFSVPSSKMFPYRRPSHSSNLKFPSIRSLKLSFNLRNCEANKTRQEEITRYRGWDELDGALAEYTDLSSLIFEMICSMDYKCNVDAETRDVSTQEDGERMDLLSRLRQELPRLSRIPVFVII